MHRYARDPDWVRETLLDAYLEPEALWFLTFVDRRDHAIFCTANRNYTLLDDPGRPMDPALDAVLCRWEDGDPALVIVPRMPNDERERHMLAFLDTIADPAARAAFDARQRAMRARWDDAWRPGSFRALASTLGPSVDEAWVARILAAAQPAIARFCEENDLVRQALTHVVFD